MCASRRQLSRICVHYSTSAEDPECGDAVIDDMFLLRPPEGLQLDARAKQPSSLALCGGDMRGFQ
eukprot:57128-Amphidinium_carterae.2